MAIRLKSLVWLLVGLLASGAAQAAAVPGQGTWETTLQGRDLDGDVSNGYEAYYDTLLDLTWTADANVAKTLGLYTEGWGDPGWVVQSDAQYLAANLSYYGTTGWRLPTHYVASVDGCLYGYSGVGCGMPREAVVSELAHLYHVTLGVEAVWNSSRGGFWVVDNEPRNTGPFWNFASATSGLSRFWVDAVREDGTRATNLTFGGFTNSGTRSAMVGYVSMGTDSAAAAWFVRDGDVAAVPEPENYAMLLVGLGLVGVVARWRRRVSIS